MREALFLTFNVDLGFFESRLLGPVRSTGAAVTVIADSAVFAPDPRSVRSAGHAYTFGVAATPGAFHPKLTVLVGPERALVGIGSGNLTVPGWHGNDEVLTTVRASRDLGAPLLLRDLVRFLRNLAEQTRISPLAVEGIARTADELTRLIDASDSVDTGHVLLDSLQGPIIDQLPRDRVDAMELAAPFHDPGGRALAALLDRHQARHACVLAQPGRAVMDPKTMRRVASDRNCDLSFVQLDGDDQQSTRYRHGKIITGLRSGSPVWSLVGSANLSAAALLGGPRANVEIGVLHRATVSLLPVPTVLVNDDASLHHVLSMTGEEGQFHKQVGVTLLEASVVPAGVEVVLTGAADQDLLTEISPYTGAPEDYMELGWIPQGQSRSIFSGSFAPASRVKVAGRWLPLADPEIGRTSAAGVRSWPTKLGRHVHGDLLLRCGRSPMARRTDPAMADPRSSRQSRSDERSPTDRGAGHGHVADSGRRGHLDRISGGCLDAIGPADLSARRRAVGSSSGRRFITVQHGSGVGGPLRGLNRVVRRGRDRRDRRAARRVGNGPGTGGPDLSPAQPGSAAAGRSCPRNGHAWSL